MYGELDELNASFDRLLVENEDEVDILGEGPTPLHYYLGEMSQGKVENMIEILRNKEHEPDSTILPFVISETLPLEQGYEALVKIMLPPGNPSRYNARSMPTIVEV
ncbi:hypothetical protein Aduo_001300 [Ancylostoma duodenale]